jgi:hypothetical protein
MLLCHMGIKVTSPHPQGLNAQLSLIHSNKYSMLMCRPTQSHNTLSFVECECYLFC